jgi:two-component system CheB/CheR fusion protein
VRDLCIFARQDLSRDPPFSKLDMVVCRNVLIYMTATLQKKLLTVFHYALKPNGFLMLGHAETIGTLSDLFAIEEKRHRIYKKKLTESVLPAVSFPVEYASIPPSRRKRAQDAGIGGTSVQNEANQLVLERFAPPGVIVDDDLQIVQFRGQTGFFLEPAPGDPSMSLLKMAREGLLYGVRTAFHAARKSRSPVRKDGLKVRRNGGWMDVSVEVLPLGANGRGHFLVLFHTVTSPDAGQDPASSGKRGKGAKTGAKTHRDDDRVRRLQEELAASREYLQSIIQEVEAANEELQSANAEILSSNEELQSTNEELDTAKEELQSTNEELNTVNEELHGRNEELSRANSDLVNLLGSVQIAIVIVASDLRIRRFTPMAERVLNLIGSDVGRPISHIKPNIDCPDLEKIIAEAVDSVTPQERDVQDRQGNWYLLRVRPYKNVENRIDGAVLALFDIQTIKRQDDELREARTYADRLFESVPFPLVVLDHTLRVRQANAAFCETFGYKPSEIETRKLLSLDKGAWNIPVLQKQLDAVLGDSEHVETAHVRRRFPRVGDKDLVTTARAFHGADGGNPTLLLAAIDAAMWSASS